MRTRVATLASALARAQIIRFGLVGSGGFVVDTGILALLHDGANVPLFAARAASILAAMTFTWLGNRTLTFRAGRKSPRGLLQEWLRFAAANAVGAIVNYLTFEGFVLFAPAPFSNRYAALVGSVMVSLAFNFSLSRRFVFGAAKEGREK